MKRPILAILPILIALLIACGGPTAETVPEEPPTERAVTADLIASGQATYKVNCVPCHGPRGQGDGPAAASLNPKPRNHSDPALMENLTDKRIAQTVQIGGIINGFPNMPASPHIKGDELVGLVAFVRSLHREEVSTVDLEGVGQ